MAQFVVADDTGSPAGALITKSPDADEETIDKYLLGGNPDSTAHARLADFAQCPTVPPCPVTPPCPTNPSAPNAPSMPPAPSAPLSPPSGELPAPLTTPLPSAQAPSALETALNLGGEPGIGFGNVPSMIGDIFSGAPTPPSTSGGPAGTYYNVPFPTTPTTGFLKLADDTSPIPRDRLIFNYSYFQDVPLTVNGMDVNRLGIGFEKTLFSDRFSVEVLMPFATTLNSDVLVSGYNLTNANAVEFGDVTVWLKALFARTETWAVSGGMGVMAPTAPALSVSILGSPNPPSQPSVANA